MKATTNVRCRFPVDLITSPMYARIRKKLGIADIESRVDSCTTEVTSRLVGILIRMGQVAKGEDEEPTTRRTWKHHHGARRFRECQAGVSVCMLHM
jgi:hypothetical protein